MRSADNGVNTFLGRALTDPATGLPNFQYFGLIQQWEERRAHRRDTHVRIVHIDVQTGNDAARRSLTVWLCQDLRTSDLIGSDGRNAFRVLLTSPDAERVDAVVERVHHIVTMLNELHDGEGEPLAVDMRIESPDLHAGTSKGPCDPCDETRFLE